MLQARMSGQWLEFCLVNGMTIIARVQLDGLFSVLVQTDDDRPMLVPKHSIAFVKILKEGGK
jgi:sRNA-binding regulator protein Hfq